MKVIAQWHSIRANESPVAEGNWGKHATTTSIYGFLPPYPANPPTKRPLVSLMKQARAFGVGLLLATQNPMDIDYRALSNAGQWCIGRLQTDADRARVIDGIAASGAGIGGNATELSNIIKRLSPPWFLMRDVHSDQLLVFLQPRWTMTHMRGPMTRNEIRQERETLATQFERPATVPR